MKNKIFRILFLFSVLLSLSSCIESNKLIGKWNEQNTLVSRLHNKVNKKTKYKIEFTKDSMLYQTIINNKIKEKKLTVEYKVKSEKLTQVYSNGDKLDIKFIDDNTITIVFPGTILKKFTRQ